MRGRGGYPGASSSSLIYNESVKNIKSLNKREELIYFTVSQKQKQRKCKTIVSRPIRKLYNKFDHNKDTFTELQNIVPNFKLFQYFQKI